MISLGINYSQMHDSSACITREGKVLFAVAEERLSRLKHDSRFPALAISACLESASLRASELDFVCFGWPLAAAALKHDLKCMATGSVPLTYVDIVSTLRRNLGFTRSGCGENEFRRCFGPMARNFDMLTTIWRMQSARTHTPGSTTPRCWSSTGAGLGKPHRYGTGVTECSNTCGRFRGRIRSDSFMRNLPIIWGFNHIAMNGR